jgi:hypothetical protein
MCFPRLVATVPFIISTKDLITSSIPMLVSFQVAYAGLRAERNRIEVLPLYHLRL